MHQLLHVSAHVRLVFSHFCSVRHSRTVSDKPPLSRQRETECALSGGCLQDEGARTLASYRGRAGLMEVIVLKKEC